MLRQGRMELEELLHPGKIRKRGCSSSASSSSSIINNYRFKRAIVVGKRAGSATPVPTWRLISLGGGGTPSRRSIAPSANRAAEDSPGNVSVRERLKNYNHQQLVSARKLAATLWEANEVFSPLIEKERKTKESRSQGKASRSKSVRTGSLPPHLSDPSHSTVSERMERSGSGTQRKRSSPHSRKLKQGDHGFGSLDSLGNSIIMEEVESKTRAETPARATSSVKSRLKDASNALMTSKELLKIMNRVWSSEDPASSGLSLISALHAEVERARLLVNQVLQHHRSDQNEINYLVKCFAEEKTAWKNKEQKVVEVAIESIVGELEAEKKLRRRLESINKKLGRELAENRSSLLKVEKELENQKAAKVVIEQVCNELVDHVKENEVEYAKNGEAEEGDIFQFTNAVLQPRAELKKAIYNRGEKNTGMGNFVSELEAFLDAKSNQDKVGCCFDYGKDEGVGSHLSNASCYSRQNEAYEDIGEVDNGRDLVEASGDSDEQPIELNMDNNTKSYKWNHSSKPPRGTRKMALVEEAKGRYSAKAPVRSKSLQRSASDVVNLGAHRDRHRFHNDAYDRVRHSAELERPGTRKDHGGEIHRNQSVMDIRETIQTSKMDSLKQYAKPTNQMMQSKLLRREAPKSKAGNREVLVSGKSKD